VYPALLLAPAFPLDAAIDVVTINGRAAKVNAVRIGDVQFAEVEIPSPVGVTVAEFRYRGGSDVYQATHVPAPGARSEGVRVLRSRADAGALRLLVEGRNGRSYDLFLRTPRQPAAVEGATLLREAGPDPIVRVRFDGTDGDYSRREVVIGLR
jgi:hypothetical protein